MTGNVNIEKLDLQDQLQWLREIIENSRDSLTTEVMSQKLEAFIEKLVANKVLTRFNQKKVLEISSTEERIDKISQALVTKGWASFETARKILYDTYPSLQGVWDENNVENIPIFSLKYENDNAASALVATDGPDNVQGVEVTDGPSSSTANPVKGLVDNAQSRFSVLPSYSMTKRRHKGLCLIINNENYVKARDNGIQLKDRRGSTKDADETQKLFKSLGFNVERQQNMTKSSLDRLLNMITAFDGLSQYNCFVAVFLSHGENEVLNCVDGHEKKIDDIIDKFKGSNCPHLNGIPKWFIVQACRGKEFNEEVTTVEHDAPGDDDFAELQSKKPISIPACADFYISYATAPGYYSFRNINEGSWFINDLVTVLKTYSHVEDVNTMMTRVNREVALTRRVQGDLGFRRQMPCHVNMLTCALYLQEMKGSAI